MMVWKRWLLLNMAIFGIYVKFLGGIQFGMTIQILPENMPCNTVPCQPTF